jgi:protein TonB
MFEDSLLESGNRFRAGRRKWTTVLSFIVQTIFICVLVIIPLIYTEALPKQQLMTFLVAPPPPPPPPPPPKATAVQVVKAQSEIVNGMIRAPKAIPKQIAMIKEEEAPPPVMTGGGVVGSIGGVSGGAMGGIIGGIASSTSAVPKMAVPKRVVVSQGVTQGMLIHQVKPTYPPLARAARIQGSVVLQAVISKTGTIENLHLIQGHPMLAPAAIEAVKQWRYKPYFLNGEPVEVETQVTVNFTLAGG